MTSPSNLPAQSTWIPRPIDNTALDAYMSCARKFYYSMVRNRRGGGPLSPALNYGTTWHAMLEAHYKTGGDEQAVVNAAVAAWKPIENPEDHRTLQRAITEYSKYLERWGSHEEEQHGWGRTVGFPEEPIVEIPAVFSWPGAHHPYTGKIDRIFELNGLYYVEDHKTTSALGATYFRQFDPSNQMMGYAWLAQLLTGKPIAGVRINAHAVLKASSKFERQTIMFSPDRLQEWSENLEVWTRKIEESYKTLATVDDPENGAPERSLNSAFPHNFNACAGKYGQCAYTSVCTMPINLRERVLEFEYAEKEWNPLNPSGDDE